MRHLSLRINWFAAKASLVVGAVAIAVVSGATGVDAAALPVPTTHISRTQIACPLSAPTSETCWAVTTLTVSTSAPAGVAQPANAPAVAVYVYPKVSFEDAYCIGNWCTDGFEVTMTAAAWYNGWSSGGYVDGQPTCWSAGPFECLSNNTWGQFWDTSYGATLFWNNHYLQDNTIPTMPQQFETYLHILVYPNGTISDAGGCYQSNCVG